MENKVLNGIDYTGTIFGLKRYAKELSIAQESGLGTYEFEKWVNMERLLNKRFSYKLFTTIRDMYEAFRDPDYTNELLLNPDSAGYLDKYLLLAIFQMEKRSEEMF